MKTKQTKTEKLIDKRIEQAYYRLCSGVQINIMDIPKVFAEGRKIVAEGADDLELGLRIATFVNTVAVPLKKR